MAVARCLAHGPPEGTTESYPHNHEPFEYPKNRIFCGSAKCRELAYVWLTEEEEIRYVRGDRRFEVRRRGTVQVA